MSGDLDTLEAVYEARLLDAQEAHRIAVRNRDWVRLARAAFACGRAVLVTSDKTYRVETPEAFVEWMTQTERMVLRVQEEGA